MRWLLILILICQPFPPPLTKAQVNPSLPSDCTLQINRMQPNLQCTVSIIHFEPGESNASLQTHEAEKQAVRDNDQSKNGQAKQGSVDRPVGGIKLYQEDGQCVPFARSYSHRDVYGLARDISTNSTSPSVGAVVITYESKSGHAAVVTNVGSDSFEVIERNFYAGWVSKRTIKNNASFIKGFVQ